MRYEAVLCPAEGSSTVIRSEKGTGANSGYGHFVMLRHANGWMTLYAHLRDRYVFVGDKVFLGYTIAKSGNSGYSTGPHLHFETIKNGARVDPNKCMYKPYRPPPENGGVIVPPDGIKGVDLSHWNKAVKVKDLAEWGAKFAWIKLTQGDWFLDDQADRYYDQCLSNGILPSFYHFYEGEPPMDKQVDWFVKHLRNREVYLPVALDFEDTITPTLHKYSKKWHTQKVYQFAKSMQFYSGYPEVTIYSRKNLWEKYVKTDAADWALLLQWKANKYNMDPWKMYTVWQYGQRKFNGVNIDLNVWNPAMKFPYEKPGSPPPPVCPQVTEVVVKFDDGSVVTTYRKDE